MVRVGTDHCRDNIRRWPSLDSLRLTHRTLGKSRDNTNIISARATLHSAAVTASRVSQLSRTNGPDILCQIMPPHKSKKNFYIDFKMRVSGNYFKDLLMFHEYLMDSIFILPFTSLWENHLFIPTSNIKIQLFNNQHGLAPWPFQQIDLWFMSFIYSIQFFPIFRKLRGMEEWTVV